MGGGGGFGAAECCGTRPRAGPGGARPSSARLADVAGRVTAREAGGGCAGGEGCAAGSGSGVALGAGGEGGGVGGGGGGGTDPACGGACAGEAAAEASDVAGVAGAQGAAGGGRLAQQEGQGYRLLTRARQGRSWTDPRGPLLPCLMWGATAAGRLQVVRVARPESSRAAG